MVLEMVLIVVFGLPFVLKQRISGAFIAPRAAALGACAALAGAPGLGSFLARCKTAAPGGAVVAYGAHPNAVSTAATAAAAATTGAAGASSRGEHGGMGQ